MKNIAVIKNKILTREQAKNFVAAARITGKTIAFTNGCFDILHEGHIFSLSQAAKEADILVVGLNSDSSVKKLKGDHRPISNEHSRALLLASLLMVDIVTIFEEDTPVRLIEQVRPPVRDTGRLREPGEKTMIGRIELDIPTVATAVKTIERSTP